MLFALSKTRECGITRSMAKALPANGEKKVKLVVPTGFNHAPMHAKASAPLSCVFALDELPAGEVRFAVTPINCWGRRGKPLVSEWTGKGA